MGEAEHDKCEDKADHRESDQRHAEGLLLLLCPAVCVRLGNQPRQSYRQARGRQREEDVIDAVGAHEHGVTLVPEDIAQGDLVEEAEDLHDDHADRQDRRTVHVVLTFGFSHESLRKQSIAKELCKSFLGQLCRSKNTISRAQRGLAPTKRGVSRTAACDKREFSIANQIRN